MITNAEYVMERGMGCLMKELGPIETAEFIMAIKTDNFDYTEWRKDFFDKMTDEEYHNAAVEYAKTHPFKGKAKII
ncbi:MAG: hypothetical protein IJ631_04545 [Schwartzia sp.]|nr:hypothetical protein [Schwartzia sp. (in: firmicutes)]